METARTITATDNTIIAYRRYCAGSSEMVPLVMIHGAASNMTRWSEFVEQTTLASSRDILLIDLRGHGQSYFRGRIGLEIWCDDIAAIMRQENHKQAIIIGHCLGANIAVMFAARFPQQTAGLVLIEPMLREALTRSMQQLQSLKLLFESIIAGIRVLNRVGFYRRHLHTIELRALDAEFRSHHDERDNTEFLAQRYASLWQDLKIMPSANFLQDLIEVSRSLPWMKIAVPFLALLSTGRRFVNPEITATRLANIPGGEIHTLKAEHWIPTEQPQLMRAAIEQWVKSCENLLRTKRQ